MCLEAIELDASRGRFLPDQVSRVLGFTALSALIPRLIRARTAQSEAAFTIVTRDGASDQSLVDSGYRGTHPRV